MVLENLITFKHLIMNKRLRQDIKSLKSAKVCFTQYAWELIEELQLPPFLEEYKSLTQICKFSEIKDIKFMETILDYLVGEKILSYKQNEYKIENPPKNDITKDLKHLENFCPGSTEWTHWLRKQSKLTLQTGNKFSKSSFDEQKGILLWDKVMQESPYSLRQIAIDQIAPKLKNNNKIIDIGCGGGIGLEEILLRTNNPIQLFGLEVSSKYLNKSKIRLQKLSKEFEGQKKINTNNVKFIVKDLTKTKLEENFDAIFISLVVNHIESNEHKKFFENLKSGLSKDGTLVTFQFLNQGKFSRSPMWTMHNIPSHKEFPFKNEFISMLKLVFPKVTVLFGGIIIICKLR
jgi:cyclopropane fatty-acyl-phospholipid synthase-like methyltransferase